MKKISIIIAVAVVLVGGYLLIKTDKDTENQTAGIGGNIATYSKADLGFEFTYKTGPDGYVLDERIPTEVFGDFLRTIILMRTEDAENLENIPVGGEGPPTITVYVFKNSKKQPARLWADENTQISNINLKIGDVAETVVGGANAIRYMADGLYASDNVVVAHGDNAYVIIGMYLDENSDLRRDFSPFIESIKFIPQLGQE